VYVVPKTFDEGVEDFQGRLRSLEERWNKRIGDLEWKTDCIIEHLTGSHPFATETTEDRIARLKSAKPRVKDLYPDRNAAIEKKGQELHHDDG
jgi:hypothetical protein